MKQILHKRFWNRRTATFAQVHELTPDEVERLPEKSQIIRVRSGKVWISISAKDVILRTGEVVAVNRSQGSAIVSGLGHKRVVYEIDPMKSDSRN